MDRARVCRWGRPALARSVSDLDPSGAVERLLHELDHRESVGGLVQALVVHDASLSSDVLDVAAALAHCVLADRTGAEAQRVRRPTVGAHPTERRPISHSMALASRTTVQAAPGWSFGRSAMVPRLQQVRAARPPPPRDFDAQHPDSCLRSLKSCERGPRAGDWHVRRQNGRRPARRAPDPPRASQGRPGRGIEARRTAPAEDSGGPRP